MGTSLENNNSESPLLGFIVGMSRSGTKWLSRCLDSHSDVAVFGETGFWGKHYLHDEVYNPDQIDDVLRRMLGIHCNSISNKGLRPGEAVKKVRLEIQEKKESLLPQELFDRVCRSVAHEAGKKWVVEKTPHHINWMNRIMSNYPRCRCIILYREPYDFMLSYKHQGDRKNEEVRSTFHAMYHPIGCALVYKNYVKSINKALRKYQENCLCIEFNTLTQDAGNQLMQIQEFLGLDSIQNIEVPKTNSSFTDTQRPKLTSEDTFWLNLLAGHYMKLLGFKPRKVKTSPVVILSSLISLPIWCLKVIAHLSQYQMTSTTKYLRKWMTG